jgi:hypothetical protein
VLTLVLGHALAAAADSRAQEVCQPKYRVGTIVWYAVETQPRAARYFDSGCTKAAGARATVLFFERGARVVIFCDLELSLPDALRAELDAVQRQRTMGLPSSWRRLAATWQEMVERNSRELTCPDGFKRMSDVTSGVPSVWCRRQLTASELCHQPGSTFSDGACYTMTCPDGTVDLDVSTGGRLAGCSRCPAGRLDLKESVAWKNQPSWSISSHGPVTAILCKARASDPMLRPALNLARPPGALRDPPRGGSAAMHTTGERASEGSAL